MVSPPLKWIWDGRKNLEKLLFKKSKMSAKTKRENFSLLIDFNVLFLKQF